MSKRLRFCGAAACAVVSLAGAGTSAQAAVPDFFGSWYAHGLNVQGITRIDVRRSGDRLFVRIWGRCHPSDCDWGEVPGRPYAPSADAPVWPAADVVEARFDNGAEHTMVLLRRAGPGLVYQSFTRFEDGSGRTDYNAAGRLDR